MKNNPILNLVIRYSVILCLGFGNLFIFYWLFTPLTFYPVYYIISIFYPVSASIPDIVINNNIIITLIDACIAGSAYYLLIILNLSVKMPLKKRVFSLLYSISTLLAINILRIFFMAVLLVNQASFFDLTHKVFWYFLSTIFVVLIWFSEVKFLKIKDIPVYSDIKELIKIIKSEK